MDFYTVEPSDTRPDRRKSPLTSPFNEGCTLGQRRPSILSTSSPLCIKSVDRPNHHPGRLFAGTTAASPMRK